MNETLIVLLYLFGVGSSMGAFFYGYKRVSDTSFKNLQYSFDLYERKDVWRKSNSHGSLKQP